MLPHLTHSEGLSHQSLVSLLTDFKCSEASPSCMQGYSKMEIVCASDLDAYRINRWAKEISPSPTCCTETKSW